MTGKALVTGGAGFIGSHLSERLLDRGWQVVALDDLSTGRLGNISHLRRHRDFTFTQGSVLDRELVHSLVRDSDVVFHLAAAVGVQLIVDRPLQSLITNIRGTETVFEAAAAAGATVLITSTSEIYGKSQNGPFKEDDDRLLGSPRKLRWSYSTSKAVDEILAYSYYRDVGLPTVIARLFNTVGPRQTGRYGMVLPRFIGQALRGEALTVYGDGRQSRVFTNVGDVTEALIRLVETPGTHGEAFNVAGREEATINELARRVIERTGSSSAIVHVPYARVYGDGFEDMARRVADTAKLERTIGYRCQTPLDVTLDIMIASERQESTV